MSDCDDRSEWQRHVGVGEQLHNVSLGSSKVPRRVGVVNDSTGKVGGYKVEHSSGRVDAHVLPGVTAAGARTVVPGDSTPAPRPPKEF